MKSFSEKKRSLRKEKIFYHKLNLFFSGIRFFSQVEQKCCHGDDSNLTLYSVLPLIQHLNIGNKLEILSLILKKNLLSILQNSIEYCINKFGFKKKMVVLSRTGGEGEFCLAQLDLCFVVT